MRGVTLDLQTDAEIRIFQLTRLMRGVTRTRGNTNKPYRFQLTRLMRGVTNIVDTGMTIDDISTHTPHARRDDRELAELLGL